eukprot:scaffold174676_cov18-Tisochrysis_lutea.AAC.1
MAHPYCAHLRLEDSLYCAHLQIEDSLRVAGLINDLAPQKCFVMAHILHQRRFSAVSGFSTPPKA